MALKLAPGKVYLRDRRNGVVYEYERSLAQSKNVDAFTAEAEKPKATPKPAAAKPAAAKPASDKPADKPAE